jgi:hypothetical protein
VKVSDIVRHSNNHYYAEINFIGPCNKAFSFQVSVIPYTKQQWLAVRRTELYSVRETKFADAKASNLNITSKLHMIFTRRFAVKFIDMMITD